MHAVWSLWSKPMRSGHERWKSRRHHLLSWVTSFNAARQHYPDTSLVTDNEGAELLVVRLGLPFGEIYTTLNELGGEHPRLWALGKLLAYSIQERPFVHLDSDVYLWQRLPSRLEESRVFAQNEERNSHMWCYAPERIEQSIGHVPMPWRRFRERGKLDWAPCCGILGGTDTKLLREYAESALEWVRIAGSEEWARVEATTEPCVHLEQYYLAGFAEFHNARMSFLFEQSENPFDVDVARRRGFTHLMAGAKRSDRILARLEARVKRDWPEYYERVNAICPE